MKKIIINNQNLNSKIFIEKNSIKKYLKLELKKNNKIFIIIDKKVYSSCKFLFKKRNNFFIIKIASNEKIKSFNYYKKINNYLLKNNINRSSTLVAIGGGTIGDLCGFIASTILRGVRFVSIPTTLLSQVDSSVGGKTAINSKLGKNLIGTFFQPSAVFIDPNTLNTLPKKELLSGYAEVVKYSLINDRFFFSWLNKNIHDNLSLVPKNKAEIVKLDEKEQKTRMLLNLGHTFAHALENELNYKIRHGEAVSLGLLMAMKLSYNLGYATKKDFNLLENHLKRSKLPINLKDLSNKKKWVSLDILKKIGKDKKSYKGNVQFILCKGIGAAFIKQNINKTMIKNTIEEFII